jgi:5-methylcytosine-specific restriction endonuclease McrA
MPSRNSRARSAARRRARRIAGKHNDLHDGHWAALNAAWGGCAYCGALGTPLQRDCVQPIARGGRYTFGNVVPACRSCNASKCDDEVTGWLRRKRLDERAFLLRHARITADLGALFAAPPAATG